MSNSFRAIGPTTFMSPIPAVMLSCRGTEPGFDRDNLITIAWAGVINTDPPMVSVSIRPERHSHSQIVQSGVFCLNLIGRDLCKATDYCGVKSGRDVDKFELAGLTAEPSNLVAAPGIAECPISLECKVREIYKLGSHDMFLADIVAVDVDPKYVDDKGALHMEKANLLAYAHGSYYGLGKQLGTFGFSVRKKPVKKARRPIKKK